MANKKALRRKKEIDVTEEYSSDIKRNSECASINLNKPLPPTDHQRNFYFSTQRIETNMAFVDGPAGSAKTYWAVYGALELLKDRHIDTIIYIRSAVESSSKSIGYLKGDEHDKFLPYMMPMLDKLNECLPPSDVSQLLTNEYVKAIPVNFVRGLTFHNCAVIVDEAQNMTSAELTTILTRFGRNSKYFILGDSDQCDIKGSGFEDIYIKFDTPHSRKNDILCYKFDHTDIVRSEILKHITRVLGV